VADLGSSGVGSAADVAAMVAGIVEDMVGELIARRASEDGELEVSIDLGMFPQRFAVTVEASDPATER